MPNPAQMRKALIAGMLLGGFSACTVTPSKYAHDSGQNPATRCGVLPVTEYMWTEGYDKMAGARVDPEWLDSAYEGFGTAAWVLATPFYVIADILVAPLRVVQPCTEPATPAAASAIAPATPTKTRKAPTARPPAGNRSYPSSRPYPGAASQPRGNYAAPPPRSGGYYPPSTGSGAYSRPRPTPTPPDSYGFPEPRLGLPGEDQ